MQTMRDIDSAFGGALRIIATPVIPDERGCFGVPYIEREALALGLPRMVRDIYSRSRENVLRGMHYQIGMSKMMRVSFGAALLVSVDIRPESPTFAQVHKVLFNNCTRDLQIWASDGIARGYLAVGEIPTEVQYKCSAELVFALDKAYRWDSFGIDWGITNPILSDRDKEAPVFEGRQ